MDYIAKAMAADDPDVREAWINRELLLHAVQRQNQCRCGSILDVRTAVLAQTEHGLIVACDRCAEPVRKAVEAIGVEAPDVELTWIDGSTLTRICDR